MRDIDMYTYSCFIAGNEDNARTYYAMSHGQAKQQYFVICWTPDGKYVGGTSMAMEVADRYNIQIFNLFHHPKLDICTIMDIYK